MTYKNKLDKEKYNRQRYSNNRQSTKPYKPHCTNPEEKTKRVRETSRRAKIKYRYGLSYEDWLQLWENQDGKCAICGKPFTEPSDAHIDHNHKTGELRELLCKKCNFGISFFDDDPKLLSKAIKYLKKYKPKRI